MNVKVAVRLRPFNSREKDVSAPPRCMPGSGRHRHETPLAQMDAKKVVEMDGPSTFLTNPHEADADPKQFTFDFSYPWDVRLTASA